MRAAAVGPAGLYRTEIDSDAYQRDYRVYVLEDCVAGTSAQGHDAALTLIRAMTNAGRAVTAADAIAALENRAKDIQA